MKCKKSLIILILAVFLLAVASASASDVNDTAIASEDSISVELTQSNDDAIVEQSNDGEIIGEKMPEHSLNCRSTSLKNMVQH